MRRILIAVTAVNLASGVALAHHTYEAFDRERKVPVEGTVVRFTTGNPHVMLSVKAAGGAVYLAEWGPPNQLRRAGLKWDMVELGDTVVVTGSPMKDPSIHRL